MKLEDIQKSRKISEEAELNVLKDFGFQLGRVVEQARSIKQKTQVELANEIGSSQSVIAKIENGGKVPSLTFLQRIAEALDTYLVPPKFGFMVQTVTMIVWHMGGDNKTEVLREYRAPNSVDKTKKYATA